ncbi:hypothetical protein SAMN02746089_01522 [Caldanaerobius fijiensis DSM 17918]|uniref:Uncharacterized protein n=1 Tax=Caldanaerobius fijiensis DSM 17918 TaxID=1121256 RepID=A0A1M4ZYP5_9THEO|nr:hypothetical protein [Caldanaerobius fijiensis]SHF23128.1 hypothetical protein SAMN02746089_01522 [Caldanaerobius fijiensis DSM 17918]
MQNLVETNHLMKNWVINLPMEEGIAEVDKAHKALDVMESSEYTGRFGLKLCGTDKSAMMTISTAAQAEAEGQYERIEQMLGYINQIISTFSIRMPGTFSEMSPDYGCFVQAWTGYGIIWPIVTYVFGIRPHAYKKEILFKPRNPVGWDNWEYNGVRIGTALFDFSYKRIDDRSEYAIHTDEDEWYMVIDLKDVYDEIYVETDGSVKKVQNGERIKIGSMLKIRF